MTAIDQNQGLAEELLVANEATNHGWTVSFPYGGRADYDLLIERGGVVLKIQVKTASPYDDESQLRQEIDNLDGYTESKVDFFAGVVDLDEVDADEEPSVDVSRHVFYKAFDDVDGQSARVNYRRPENMEYDHSREAANLAQDFDFEARIEPHLPREDNAEEHPGER